MLSTINAHMAIARMRAGLGGGGTQPSVRYAVDSYTTDRKSSWTATLPTNSANDILFCFLWSQYSSNSSWTATSGWTQLFTQTNGSGGISGAAQWKRSSGSESNPTINAWETGGGPGGDVHAIIVSIQDCLTSGDPFDDFTSPSGTGANMSSHTITPTVDDGLATYAGAIDDWASFTTSPPPSGWSLVHQYGGGGVGMGFVTSYNTATVASSNVSGVTQATHSVAEPQIRCTFALKPVP